MRKEDKFVVFQSFRISLIHFIRLYDDIMPNKENKKLHQISKIIKVLSKECNNLCDRKQNIGSLIASSNALKALNYQKIY